MKTGQTSVIALCVGLVGWAVADRSMAQQVAGTSKIEITTSSEEARELFLKGRDLDEKLRATDAREYYIQAIEKDPYFALAHMAMANTAPTTKELFYSLGAAVAMAEAASKGEQHLIYARDADIRGAIREQRDQLTALVAAFPDDERAHHMMGNFHFSRQEYTKAITRYKKAAAINPTFARSYNQMGYAYRELRQYDEAETAFKKYVELIPDEPNPYDSYAELLMKVGRFEESIEHYAKALERNPNFVASYVGIGNNYLFMDKVDQARTTFAKLAEVARNDDERREAIFWTAASYVHEGKRDEAIEAMERACTIADEGNDPATLSEDYTLMGDILLELGAPDEALTHYKKAVEVMAAAPAPAETKEATRRNQLYFASRVANAKGELELAESKADHYGDLVAFRRIPLEIRRHQELLGALAMQEGQLDRALEYLRKANQENPRVLHLTAQVLQQKGNTDAARAACERAAHFNGLDFDYAFVRGPARRMLEEMPKNE